MSPTFRALPKNENPSRERWSAPRIFLVLGLLTALMGLLIYATARGAGGSSTERPGEIRAAR